MIADAVARENVAAVRKALQALGLVVAEVDRDLRYVWIDNPHPDFDPHAVIGKRDDELLSAEEAMGLMSLKRDVIASGIAETRLLDFRRSDGPRYYNVAAFPVTDAFGRVTGVVTAAVDITEAQLSGARK